MSKNEKMLRLGAAAVTLLALAGCSAIGSGTITNKENEPRRMYVCGARPVIICIDDEDWRFDLSGTNDKGEPVTGWVYVTEETFDAYEVGDYYQGPGQ